MVLPKTCALQRTVSHHVDPLTTGSIVLPENSKNQCYFPEVHPWIP